MKKYLISLIALSVLAQGAFAQDDAKNDSFFLNHVALGVTGGFDGVGGDIILPLGRHIQVRGGYSTLAFYTYQSPAVHVNITDPWTIDDDISASVNANVEGARLLFDFYPGRKGGLHFTVGAYYGLNTERGVIGITSTDPLPIPESEWGNTGIELKRDGAPSEYVTTDKQGYLKVDLRMGNPIGESLGMPTLRPYAGIGFGRNLKEKGSLSFTMDLGVLYCGNWGVYGWDYLNDDNGKPVRIQRKDLSDFDDKMGDAKKYVDMAFDYMDNKLPIAPILKFNLVFKLF